MDHQSFFNFHFFLLNFEVNLYIKNRTGVFLKKKIKKDLLVYESLIFTNANNKIVRDFPVNSQLSNIWLDIYA